MRYAIVNEEYNLRAEFANYREARKELTDCRKNWEEQINEMDDTNPKRIMLIRLYWDTKLEKIN